MTLPDTMTEANDLNFEGHIQRRVANALEELGVDAGAPLSASAPPREELGDVAIACFPLAEKLRSSPVKIAAMLTERIAPDEFIERVSADGPYINFAFRTPTLAKAVLLSEKAAPAKQSEHVLVEFSSPNTNKPQHLGHLRNNLLGESTSRILKHAGRRVTKVNLINDRGIHICKSMLAYRKFRNGETPANVGMKGDKFVGECYVQFETALREEYAAWLKTDAAKQAFEEWSLSPAGRTAENKRQKQAGKAEKQGQDARAAPSLWDVFRDEYKDAYFNAASTLGREARQMLVEWEASEPATRALWEMMNSWVYEGFDGTYARLGVSFDHIDYESETYLRGKQIVDRGLDLHVFKRDPSGAVTFDLSKIGLEGRKVLLREDGTSVYMTQDLGNAYVRFEKFGPQRMIYVVADEQRYHFQVLFGILAELRQELRDRCYHLAYGMVMLPEGRMKSREGTVVDADDLLDELRALALKETSDRWPDLDEAERLRRAEIVGQAALKYFVLNVLPKSTMIFDPRKSLDFTGATGPYCLYAYARARSIFERAGVDFATFSRPGDYSKLQTREEHALLMALHRFEASIERAAVEFEPSHVVHATYAIAKAFSAFYFDRDKHPIATCEDADLRKMRLALTQDTATKLQKGLNLVCIETLDQM